MSYVVKTISKYRFDQGQWDWHFLDQGQSDWHFPLAGQPECTFDTKSKAWKWAKDRSFSPQGKNGVYQVFDEFGKPEGLPYFEGRSISRKKKKKEEEEIVKEFKLQWKHTDQDNWKWFDQYSVGERSYSLDEAITRCKKTSFTGIHKVRIIHNDAVIFSEKAKTAQLVAFLTNYGQGEEILSAREKQFSVRYRSKFGTNWYEFDSSYVQSRHEFFASAQKWALERSLSHPNHTYAVFDGDTQISSEIVKGMYTENLPTNHEQENDMNISKPLNVPRTTIIEKIEAYLEKREAEHNEKVAKAQEKNQKRLDVFRQLFEAEPLRTVANCGYTSDLAHDVANEHITYERALESLQKMPEFHEVGAYQSDTDAEKTLSVLKAAADETIEVSTESSLYRYL